VSSDEPVGYVSFANFPQTTVSNGGTAALSQGASEQWTVSSSATFPGVSTSPPTTFCVADTAATSEIVQVTAITSNVWGVTRGAEGTTPVTHATNFTVQQVVTAGALQNFTQYPNSGATVASTAAASGLRTLATYVPPTADIPAPGNVYDMTCFGAIWDTTSGLTLATTWNIGGVSTTLASAISGTNGTLPTTLSTSAYWLEGKVCCWGASTMTCGFNFMSYGTPASHTIASLLGASTAGISITGGAGTLAIVANLGAASSITTTGYYIHRAG
jgi:hypothetical protein